jgi:hypothetical protein
MHWEVARHSQRLFFLWALLQCTLDWTPLHSPLKGFAACGTQASLRLHQSLTSDGWLYLGVPFACVVVQCKRSNEGT